MLVGVWTDGSAADADASLAELAALAETAGSEVLEGLIQRRDKPDPSTYIGSGKALELRDIVVATGADTVICDGELSPAQLKPPMTMCRMLLEPELLTDQVADDVRECLGNLVFDSVIPRNVRLSEAPSHGLPALVYDHSCAGSRAYMALARELIRRLPQERKAA